MALDKKICPDCLKSKLCSLYFYLDPFFKWWIQLILIFVFIAIQYLDIDSTLKAVKLSTCHEGNSLAIPVVTSSNPLISAILFKIAQIGPFIAFLLILVIVSYAIKYIVKKSNWEEEIAKLLCGAIYVIWLVLFVFSVSYYVILVIHNYQCSFDMPI